MSGRNKVLSVGALVAVAIFAIFVTQAPGKKHKHATVQIYGAQPVLTGPGGVGTGIVFCPSGTLATGGGEDYVSGIATVDMGFEGNNAYYVLVDNTRSTTSSQMNVQVACTAGTTKARGRELSREQVEANVEAKADALRASYAAQK